MKQKLARRRFFTLVAAGTAAYAVAPLSRSGLAQAEEAAKLEETAPQAVALGYKHDATAVDASKYTTYKEGQNCAGCQLYAGGDGEWGQCALFPGKQVNSKGWCSAYAPKAS